ncbi:unnamed protein product [Diatraea saccharalis]|uniref:Timeless C-terminal domain-containing protein n=1 Tax=Diatraea saccharalis TaxID=40085 RepID=A0A9P0C3L9_9NEOP|nr:unnamed protein product [Diatraea saccharalis]
MVQLIALFYKDQHVVTLHKLLNMWLEATLSDSSEDNESNTSPPDRGSDDSSPMLTSDPTSDSSDTGGSGKSNDETNVNSVNDDWNGPSVNNNSEISNEPFQSHSTEKESHRKSDYTENNNKEMQFHNVKNTSCIMNGKKDQGNRGHLMTNEKKTVISENSDCGYGTQIENQESISTSSNEDELPAKKPVHQKPHNSKQRINNKGRSGTITQDRKRKKIVRRGKSNILNVQGLLHKTPTDDDISNMLKEFTVDFLLKGYNYLVQTLHSQILTNLELEIDTSHFFWLVTYFLKFATQIELDVEHVCSVLSFDIASYLTAEGVNLCEQFELAIKLDGNDLKPSIRRLHLVVTAIREFVQAVEAYKKFTHICQDDKNELVRLQIKMCETKELRSLLVLLLRHYNPKYHSKQYLQDLVVTNHILLTFLDNVMKLPEYTGTTNMLDHIKQFATTEVMYQYGLLLEDYAVNGEFVNDCIFTLMHHIGGEIGSIITLFQPKILKTFTSMWKSDFEICDDWSDLIEYVINAFIKQPHAIQSSSNFRLKIENIDNDKVFAKPEDAVAQLDTKPDSDDAKKKSSSGDSTSKDRWADDELSSLSWNYMQYSSKPDPIGELVKMFKEDGIVKTRESVIKELFKQNLIDKDTTDNFMKGETERSSESSPNKETIDDEINKICEQLVQDGKSNSLDWVQKVLLETCYAKIYIEKRTKSHQVDNTSLKTKFHKQNLGKKTDDFPVVSPVSYHSLLCNQSVPLVPWNCEEASTCKDLKFLQLLNKLGFHMPVDTGKVFIRIPHHWSAEILYEVACKILPVNDSLLRFSLNDITDSSGSSYSVERNNFVLSKNVSKDLTVIDTPENFYQVHKQNHLATMVNFTPMPGSSFNPEGGELEKPTWFELVQKSQEYKIALNLERQTTEEGERDIDSDVLMCEELPTPLEAPELTAPSPPFVPSSLHMPALPTETSVKQEPSNFNIQPVESEFYNNSVCETASVASDLTRMYVSDEDEKPEDLVDPVVNVTPILDESSDADVNKGGKRPRVQFSPTF